MSKPKKKRDRAFKKRVYDRVARTGESYQLALRRQEEEEERAVGSGARESQGITLKEAIEETRRYRAAEPRWFPQYAQTIDEREMRFEFCERVVPTPSPMWDEPDRMRAMGVALIDPRGACVYVVLKLSNGEYEVWLPNVGGSRVETVRSFEELERKYGSCFRSRYDPSEPVGTPLYLSPPVSLMQLSIAMLRRFQGGGCDFFEAVRVADPTSTPSIKFATIQFEFVSRTARYARFFADYAAYPPKDHVPDGRVVGEIELSVRSGDHNAIATGLRLVELHAHVWRRVGQVAPESRLWSPHFESMVRHLRDHTGEVELEGNAARLYVLRDGRRKRRADGSRAGSDAQGPMTAEEQRHLLRAGAFDPRLAADDELDVWPPVAQPHNQSL